MNLVLSSIKFNTVRAKARADAQYHHEQARQLAANPESAHRAYDPETNSMVVTQPPMRATARVTGISTECGPATIPRHYQSEPKAPAIAPEPVTASPVDVSIGEIQAMSDSERAVILRRIMAFDGARERMKPVPGRTLAEALIQELDYQRRVIREARGIVRKGKTVRHSKTAAKRDNYKGYRKMKDGGTARMIPNRRAETFYVNVVAPMVEGYEWVRPIRRNEKLVIKSNSES